MPVSIGKITTKGGPVNAGVTPLRNSHIRFDLTRSTLVEAADEVSRRGAQMADASQNTGMRLLESGGWAMKPYQMVIHNLVERTPLGLVLVTEIFAAISAKVVNRFKPSNLLGVAIGADPGLTTAGDPFLTQRVTTGLTMEQTQHAADVAAYPHPNLPSENIKMDRHGVGKVVYRANQGFGVRFRVPGGITHAPDNLWTFYHGGDGLSDPAHPGRAAGGGFATTFHGDGTATTSMRMADASGNIYWQPIGQTRYADPHAVIGRTHVVFIHPHSLPMSNSLVTA